MWTRLLRSQSIPKLSTLLRLASTVLQLREISTNSAIHRGIRKSQIKPKFAHRIREPTKPKPLLNKFQRQYEKLQQRTKESRPRRPNHAGRQDTEDIRESAEQARIYGNRRLERDQRGSRRRPAASPAFLSRNEGVLKGEPRVRSGFLTNIINGQTGRRRDNSYENDRKTLKNRENSYEGVRELDGRDVPGHSEYAHWQHHENVSSSRQGGRRSTESITDTRSEARTSTKRRHEEPVEDSSSRAIAQGKDNRPGARTGDESRLRYQRAADTSRFEGRVPGEAPTPLSIPYTTPASEFLYGTSVVMAALKADHRKFYKLYMYSGENRSIENLDEEVKRLARRRAVEVVKVGSDWVRLLDKMSSGRPHNGYILEASPLAKHPAAGLRRVEGHNKSLVILLEHQTKEDIAINGRDPFIKYKTSFSRYPFLLMLDEICDPGNLGAILRSAHFLGADGVIYSQRNCAPLSAIALKASAGASESLPLIPVQNPPAFIEHAQTNGWKFYAAAASQHEAIGRQKMVTTSTIGSPLRASPCIVMLGSEGQGLRLNLLKKADYLITIEGQRKDVGGVDSLNVSVAAALLCEAMLRRPAVHQSSEDSQKVATEEGEAVDTNTSGGSTGKDLF